MFLLDVDAAYVRWKMRDASENIVDDDGEQRAAIKNDLGAFKKSRVDRAVLTFNVPPLRQRRARMAGTSSSSA